MNCASRMNQPVRLLLFLTAIVMLAGPSGVNAQQVASSTADATVLAQLTLTATGPQFGNVYPGTAKTASKAADAEAGIIRLTGNTASEFNLVIALPTHLANGGDWMIVEFSSTAADLDAAAFNDVDGTALPSAGGTTDWNPHSQMTDNLTGAGDFAVFLGGTVHPQLDQAAGAYSGDVVVSVWYTGN